MLFGAGGSVASVPIACTELCHDKSVNDLAVSHPSRKAADLCNTFSAEGQPERLQVPRSVDLDVLVSILVLGLKGPAKSAHCCLLAVNQHL